jgi:hypothetical protein
MAEGKKLSISEDLRDLALAAMELDELGLPLSDDLVSKVLVAGFDGERKGAAHEVFEEEAFEEGDIYDGRQHLWLYKSPDGRESEPAYFDRIPKEWVSRWHGKEITKKDWLPEGAPEEVTDELRRFVLSGIPRFDKLVAYEPFWLYCEQARRWGPTANKMEDMLTDAQQEAYSEQEFWRADENKLYACDSYAYIKDDSVASGMRKYYASTPQALLLFAKDCGFSFGLLKGRQAAITSTLIAAAVVTAMVKPSYKGAMVVDKVDTGKGLMKEKFKPTLQMLPDWWKPDPEQSEPIWNPMSVVIDFEKQTSKVEKRRYSASFDLFPSSDSQSVNSNTPSEVYYDEAQKTDSLADIIGEVRPTQMAEVNGELKVVRQQFYWGTGGTGSMSGAFQADWQALYEALQAGEDTGGWLVFFFDAFCRPYMDEKTLRKRYSEYMRGSKVVEVKGKTPEQKRALFGAHYPMSPQDCFMGTDMSVVPQIMIKKFRDSIYELPDDAKPVAGWLEPVFDETKPMPAGSFLPFALKDAMFKKGRIDDYKMPVKVFRKPVRGWKDRYFMGTDPIQSDSGQSMMSSSILDAAAVQHKVGSNTLYIPTLAAISNHRSNKSRNTFMQSVLLGVIYRNWGELKCPELLEIEQGQSYAAFQEEAYINTYDSLIDRAELPGLFSGGQHHKGVSMKKDRKSRAHAKLIEMIYDIGPYIKFIEFWNQLQNIQTIERQDGSIDWHTKDVRSTNDDIVFSSLYAFMAWQVRGDKKPQFLGDKPELDQVEEDDQYVRMSDDTLVYVRR